MQTEDTLDLGHGHTVDFTSWRPERAITPEYDHLPDVERYGLLIKHSNPQGNPCMGSVVFDSPTFRELHPGKTGWTVESWVPLTLSPSILCSCGDHGWIREGYWVPA
jgi:hypothetical protein